jgi:hypothetical protein
MTKWTKYSFVCTDCDSLIEYTCNEFGLPTGSVNNITCICGGWTVQTSVADATILPSTNERHQMETATPTYLEEQVRMLQDTLKNHQNCDYWKSENGRVQSQIIALINDSYESEADASEILISLGEIIDYEAKKTIQFSGTITFSGSIDVPMSEVGDFDLHYFLQDEMSLDINHGDTVIDSYEVEDVREDY